MSGADAHESSVRHGGALELRFLAWAFWHSAYNSQAALTAAPFVTPGLTLGAPPFSDWLERMPIRPGQTQLALVPPYEKWALEILTRADYDDYWKHPSLNPRAHWDRFPEMPILFVGGWYDSYTRATFQNFVGARRGRTAAGARPRRPVDARREDGGAVVRRRRGVRARGGAAELRRAAPALVRPVAARRGQRPRRRGAAPDLRDGRRLGPALGRGPARARRPLARRARVAARPHAVHRLLPARRRIARARSRRARRRSATTYRFDPAHPVPSIGGNVSSLRDVLPLPAGDRRPELRRPRRAHGRRHGPGRLRPARGARVSRLPPALSAARLSPRRPRLPDRAPAGAHRGDRSHRGRPVGGHVRRGHRLHGQARSTSTRRARGIRSAMR